MSCFLFDGDRWAVAYFTDVLYDPPTNEAPARLRLSAYEDRGLRGAEPFDLEGAAAEDVAEQLGLA